jgi:transposase
MRGADHQQADMYSYLSPEARVRADHSLRAIRAMADQALAQMNDRFDSMYAKTGRPSIPPEKLLRAQLIQMLYSVRSERLLMEEIDYSMLFRWFVGMNLGAILKRCVKDSFMRTTIVRTFLRPLAVAV